MRNLFRAIIFLVMGLLLIACGQSVTATPSPTITITATVTPIPSQTTTATIEATPRPEYVPPTLIPTIDPTLLPELFSKAFSIQTFDMNGYSIRRITDWELGFGGGFCDGYNWLDSNHLILYPSVGQRRWGEGGQVLNLATQPVVINMDTGHFWLPPSNKSESPFNCRQLNWSRELKILVTTEIHGDTSSVSTYTYDGKKLANYLGKVLDVSPSGTKILVDDNTVIDLRTNKRTRLAWNMENYQEEMLSGLFWTYPEETRVYRCCYFYADLSTGLSYRFERSDFQDTNGNHLNPSGLWFYRGQWVRNDTYFLVEWSMVDDGDIRYLPMFDPAKKIVYDVREMAGILDDWTAWKTRVSPDGNYVWMTGSEGSYLVNLFTFESRYYPDLSYVEIDWSPNSQFVWLYLPGSGKETRQYSILSIADKEIRPFPVKPLFEWNHWWRENDDILIYPSEDKNNLIILDASTMSFRELPFAFRESLYFFSNLAWSPNGEKIAIAAEDGSLWQVNYPKLDNLEQLTPSLPDVHDVNWSPDGNSIAFISGSDIYIVDTVK